MEAMRLWGWRFPKWKLPALHQEGVPCPLSSLQRSITIFSLVSPLHPSSCAPPFGSSSEETFSVVIKLHQNRQPKLLRAYPPYQSVVIHS
ncbi:hypothetical protein BDV59DRAFT_172250 [Aspergillus ambiguus]|uniref:uncharacterized protein n=1 Tax=Aspergillus ambiguus TaxID=176160 RepID=UPI003CCDDFBE